MCQGSWHQQAGQSSRIKVNHQFSTELRMKAGNGLYEAGGKEEVSHNASEGIEPRNTPCCTKAKGFISLKPEMIGAIG